MADTTTAPLLGRCKECDYAIFASNEDVKPADDFKAVKAGTGVYRVGNNGHFARCTNGHKFFAVKRIKGTYSKDHKCDARCLNAKGHDCTCSCGGMNHGRGHVVTVTAAADVPAELPPTPWASEKQINFIKSLMSQKLDGDKLEQAEARLAKGLTKKLASDWITRLKDM